MDSADRQRELEIIEDVANEAISEFRPEDFPDACVNWGDLRAIEARWVLTRDTDYYEVILSEASPDNRYICSWLERLVGDKGYHVVVSAEW